MSKGRFVAVDSGKYNTKVCALNTETKETPYCRFKFRTKMSEGTFADDMLEKGTILVGYEDKVYKLGPGAKQEAELETSKMSEIHKISTLAAIARCVSQKETDTVNVAMGIPYQICCVVEERLKYKDYILPEGEHTVKIKLSNDDPVQTVNFHVGRRFVYPESIGVLYEYPDKLEDITGIIDIGNLNINCTYSNRFSIMQEGSFTGELGGQILISGLAQQLSSEMGFRVDDNLVASVLLAPIDKRFLRPKNPNKEAEVQSKKIIEKYLRDHVLSIKRKCDAKHWPLEYMNIACIGGTSKLLVNELRDIFGNSVFIPENPEYVNVEGFLKMMCASMDVDAATYITK